MRNPEGWSSLRVSAERFLRGAPLFGAGVVLWSLLVFPVWMKGVFLLVLGILALISLRFRFLFLAGLLGLCFETKNVSREWVGVFRVEEDRVVAWRPPGSSDFRQVRILLNTPITPPGYIQTVSGRLKVKGASASFRGDMLEVEPASGVRARIRRWVAQRLDVYPPETRGMFVAMLLGNRLGLSRSAREALKRAGLFHILALSGLHVGFWLGMVWLLGVMLGLPFRWRYGLLLSGLVLYLWVEGVRPSILRASVMAGLWTAGKLLGRPLRLAQVWGGALFFSLLIAPHQAASPGLILSFLATGGIFLVLPEIRNHAGWMQGLMVSIGASLATWPYLAWAFGGVNLLAPLWNALALPLVGFAYIEAMLSLLGGVPFAWIAHHLMSFLLRVAERLPGFLDVRLSGWEMVGLYGGMLGVYFIQRRRRVTT